MVSVRAHAPPRPRLPQPTGALPSPQGLHELHARGIALLRHLGQGPKDDRPIVFRQCVQVGGAAERGAELTTDLDTFLTGLLPAERAISGKKYGVGVYFFEENTLDNSEVHARTSEVENLSDDSHTKAVGEIDVLNTERRK